MNFYYVSTTIQGTTNYGWIYGPTAPIALANHRFAIAETAGIDAIDVFVRVEEED